MRNGKEKYCGLGVKMPRSRHRYCSGDDSVICDYKSIYKRLVTIYGEERKYHVCLLNKKDDNDEQRE
jgi:hypothetical protein